jgi:hypothetical protein
MMEEKSGLDELVDNLIELGLIPLTHKENRTFLFATKDRFVNTKFVTASLSDSMHFLAYSSGNSHPFSGLYSSIEGTTEAEYKIYKKTWLDPLLFFRRKKSGNRYIDENISIVSSNWIPSKEISIESVHLFLKINAGKNPYSLILQNDYLPMIRLFKGKKIVGIESNNWLWEKEDLKLLLETGHSLIQYIKNNIA